MSWSSNSSSSSSMYTSYKRSGFDTFPANADDAKHQLAQETTSHWIGPFPAQDFLDFLDVEIDEASVVKGNIFSKVPSSAKALEETMYRPLITSLNSLCLKNLVFVNTSTQCDPLTASYKEWRPDISVYASDFEVDDPSDTTYSEHSRKAPKPSNTSMSELLLSFEVKRGDYDPFEDHIGAPPKERINLKFEREGIVHEKSRGQLALILNEMLGHSFRTHAFSVYMNGSVARLLRADRAGIIVSEAFSYRSSSNPLTEFLRRFDSASLDQRGVDTTALPVGIRVAGEAQSRLGFSLSVPVVAPQASKSLRHINVFIEGKSLPQPESLVSRARRVFAVQELKPEGSELECGKRYYMKDGWRADLPGMKTEQDVVAELHQNVIPHIPVIVAGGDVTEGPNHRTLTHAYVDRPWRIGPPVIVVPRVHYRFLEEEIEKPLCEFKDAKELCQVLSDVIEALQAAWERCKYLHRDISPANIMIDKKGRGILIDWEFSKKISQAECEDIWQNASPPLRHPNRTGTWYYMSSALLRFPDKEHSTHDDLQSVFWVLADMTHNYLPHQNSAMRDLASSFIEYDPDSNPETGRGGKLKFVYLSEHETRVEFLGNSPLSQLFKQFHAAVADTAVWYHRSHSNTLTLKNRIQLAHSPPDHIPSHYEILDLFMKALDQPNIEWSEVRNEACLLQKTIDEMQEVQAKTRMDSNVHKRRSASSAFTTPTSSPAKQAKTQASPPVSPTKMATRSRGSVP